MAKQSFFGWLILLLAGSMFTSVFFTEIGKTPWNLSNLGLLLLFAYLVYQATKGK